MQTAETVEELWAGLPASNVFKQKKLTGDVAIDDSNVERRAFAIEGERYVDLLRRDFDAVMLGAYHVALQWTLDDVESLIGSAVAATLRASYVYSEDEDAVDALVADVERQLRSDRAVAREDVEAWDTRRAPAFFYGDGDAAATVGARVLVAAAARAEHAEVVISMPGAVAQAVGIDDFCRRYETIVDALIKGECATVGELKAQLGAAGQVPYRQLQEMKRRVIALWAKVLGIAETELHDSSSYFEVGGTSLNAFKLVNRVRVEFQRDISIRDIIESSTVAEFARLLLKD